MKMKYCLIALLCLPMALMAQNGCAKDTFINNQNHYLVKNGGKYLFTHEQWEKMTLSERAELVAVKNIQEALKRLGYYHGKIKNKWNRASQKAFTNFQMDTELPPFPHAITDHFKALGLL